MSAKLRNYVATFFKEPEIKLPEGVRYIILGKESCPTSGRLHWQSYIELSKPMRISTIKKLFNDNTIHLEARRGTREEAKQYCMKDGEYEEFGKWIKGQGHRSDLDDIVDSLQRGERLSEIMVSHPVMYCKYRNGLKDIANTISEKRIPSWRDVEVVLITGPTGSGKTKMAMEEATYKIQAGEMTWWDGYDGDEAICIDEYDNDVKITKMLGILDGYKLRLPVKGGFTSANWKKVFITTNLRMRELHPMAKSEHVKALMRRITKVVDLWEVCSGT